MSAKRNNRDDELPSHLPLSPFMWPPPFNLFGMSMPGGEVTMRRDKEESQRGVGDGRQWRRERLAREQSYQRFLEQMTEEIRGLRRDLQLQNHQIRQEGFDEGERRATQRIIDVLKQRGIDIPPEIAPDDAQE